MDNYQLKELISLLERFREDYTLDSMLDHVYIPGIIKRIKKKLEE